MFLQASLGLSMNAVEQRVVFNRPALPDSVSGLSSIDSLRLGGFTVDLKVGGGEHEVKVNIYQASDRLDVVVHK